MTNEIIIFYKYTPVADPEAFKAWTKNFTGQKYNLKGRIIIAAEGINGTLEGTTEDIAAYEEALRGCEFGDFGDVWFKHSPGTPDQSAFPKLWVRVRPEIVTLRLANTPLGDVDPRVDTGTHIQPEELKSWFEKGEEFEIIDMRNSYEYDLGHFKNSVDPQTESFFDLPKVIDKLEPLKKKKVLTVCTYGVRCEKASAYLKQQGFTDVYQLHGGIGSYMKMYPGQDFDGSLYVFDNRLAERFTDDYSVVGTCYHCATPSETYVNCKNDSCHRHMIVCAECNKKTAGICGSCIQKHTDIGRIHKNMAM
jgi:UPF0176 protein